MQHDPSKCVLLVGAGLSASGVRQGGKGLPDWDTLMQHMIEDLRDSEKCDAGTLTELEELLREGKHLTITRVFKQRTRSDQFAAFLKAELDPPDIVSSRVHEIILRTGFRGIITTNFDLVFEHQSNLLQPLVYPQCFDDTDAFRNDGFFAKIHGCIRNTANPAENLVLTEESYIALRSNRKYCAILYSLFVMHPILTVGFSLRDPDFLGLIDDLREIFGTQMPTIYALMLKTEHKAREEWREKGVEIIPYTDHTELVGFFEEMLHLTEETRTGAARRSKVQHEETPYEETPHKQKIRELAGRLKSEIGLPWIGDCFVVDLKPGRFFLGREMFPISIGERKEIEIELRIEGDQAIAHLYQGLRSHLKTGHFSEVVVKTDSWKLAAAENLEKCYELITLVRKDVEETYGVSIPTQYREQLGLTEWFPLLICADAVQHATGFTWITDSWYKYDGFDLRCGSYLIYRAVSSQDLEAYKNAHTKMRTEYATNERVRQIAKQREGLRQTAEDIGAMLEKFRDMEHLPGQCELCFR